jgi:hypothetical protein
MTTLIDNRDDKFLDKIIQEKFTANFMNNKKWVKLISTLVSNQDKIKKCLIKPIWEDLEPTRHLIIDESTTYNFDYYDNSMEAMVSGTPRGWYTYKEIEWLDFPKREDQNLTEIQDLLNQIGQFKTELTNSNLRLYAYLK